jgi:hypothetical protein
MLSWLALIISLPICYLLWIECYPDQARTWFNSFRLWWRSIIIRKIGAEDAKAIYHHLRRFARQKGIAKELVDEVFNERKAQVIHLRGRMYVDTHKSWLNEEI